MTFKKIYLTIAIIPVVLVTIFVLNNITFSNRKDFNLEIDALKEENNPLQILRLITVILVKRSHF
jgi:hypothetical protein